MRCEFVYPIIYLGYTFLAYFALFNILTAILVEKAVVASRPQPDDIVKTQCQKWLREAEEFRMIGELMDEDGSGDISREEYVSAVRNDRIAACLASAQLEMGDPAAFFDLLADGHDRILLEDFVNGCLTMKGNATSLDMRIVHRDLCTLSNWVSSLEKRSKTPLQGVSSPSRVSEQHRLLSGAFSRSWNPQS